MSNKEKSEFQRVVFYRDIVSLGINLEYYIEEINYTNYPLVLTTSYDRKDGIEELPFALESENAKEYLSRNNGLQNLFGYIGAKNTLKRRKCLYVLRP